MSDANDPDGLLPTEIAGTVPSSVAVPPSGGSGGNALPAGYRLHEFELIEVVGEGGFSIVYLATDLQLQRKVAVKEYIPVSLAARGSDYSITVRSARHRETFELGMRSFINEGRLLASFDHPSLLKVYRFWEQNGTAYMVMPFYSGPTLKALLKQLPQPPDEAWLKRLLSPLLDALQVIHADHVFHRDIAPDNILLLGTQLQPLLLDFGAARRVIGDATQALTVILKPGYAPVEQYAEVASMKQGAWTDVYAVCAVLYTAITGRAPTPSVGRIMHDELVPLASVAASRYTGAFLAAIDHGLAVRPEDRPQDIATLRTELFGAGALPDDPDVTVIRPTLNESASRPREAAVPTLVVSTAAAPRIANAAPATRSKAPLLTAVVVALLSAGGVGWFATRPKSAPPVVAARLPPPDIAPASAPAPEARAAAAAPARPAFGVEAVLEDIVRHSDPVLSVNVLADKESVVIARDKIRFRVRASEAGYVYVFFSGTGDPNLTLLFPNAIDKNNGIGPDRELQLPREGWQLDAGGPPGVDNIVVIVSRAPRDFAAVGLRAGKPLSTFDLDTVKSLWNSAPTDASPFAGRAGCAAGSVCPEGFGATLLRIAEVSAAK